MSFYTSARCCLNALGSTSRSTRAAQLPRPQLFLLPSLVAPRSISQQPSSSPSDHPNPITRTSNRSLPLSPSSTPPSPPTSTPLSAWQSLILDFKFSSITTPESLAAALKTVRSIPPSELALLPNDQQRQRTVTLNVLTKASKMHPNHRAAYFKDVDLGHQASGDLESSRREKAKEQVESGLWDESDALSAEYWEAQMRSKREANLDKRASTTGWSRDKLVKEADAQEKRWRRLRLERLEVRRELKKGQRGGKGFK